MNKPIILDNALERVGNSNKVFEYNYSKDMNVVLVNEEVIPFIDMNGHIHELITETRVERESDDETFSMISEMLTKTALERESDDEGCSLLELTTKTEAIRERDDEEISFAELYSKTFVDRERDDEDDINYNQ